MRLSGYRQQTRLISGIEKMTMRFLTKLPLTKELGPREETLRKLTAPKIPAEHGFYDECIKGEVEFSLGFIKCCPSWLFGNPDSFGAPGAGGSLGFADPQVKIGYGYIPNRIGVTLTGDPRDVAIGKALYSATPVIGKSVPNRFH